MRERATTWSGDSEPRPAMRVPESITWRHLLLALIVAGSLGRMLLLDPIPQQASYHVFADARMVLMIPNALNVLSNVVFLLVGALGLGHCLRSRMIAVSSLPAWIGLFAGFALVGAGSAYYHWSPNDATLVWDRLPMTLGFMGLFVALLGESIGERFTNRMLVPAILIGFGSVLFWQRTGDLRLYYWVQIVPLVSIPVVILLFRGRYSHRWLLLVALGCYVLAKFAETQDSSIFEATQTMISGHTVKHLLAAAGGCSILAMLRSRRRLV